MDALSPEERDHLIARYLEDDLTPEDRRAVEQAVADDPQWRADMDLAERILGITGRMPPYPSPGLWSGVEQALTSDLEGSLWRGLDWAGRRVGPLLAVAAVVAITALSLMDVPSEETALAEFLDTQESSLLAETDLDRRILPDNAE